MSSSRSLLTPNILIAYYSTKGMALTRNSNYSRVDHSDYQGPMLSAAYATPTFYNFERLEVRNGKARTSKECRKPI